MSGEIQIARLEEILREARTRKARAEEVKAKAQREIEAATQDEVAVTRVLELAGLEIGETESDKDEPVKVPENETSFSEDADGSSTNGHSRTVPYTREVRNLLDEFEGKGRFEPKEMAARIQRKYPDLEIRTQTVSTVLWRMADKGERVRKVREGYGTVSNSYEVISPDGATQEGLAEDENLVPRETPVGE